MLDYLSDRSQLIELTNKGTHPKHKHLAIIFEGVGYQSVVAIANNTKTRHAEDRAIEIAKINLGDHDLFKYNLTLLSCAVTKDGKFKLAKPCERCQRLLFGCGINTIIFTTKNQTLVKNK